VPSSDAVASVWLPGRKRTQFTGPWCHTGGPSGVAVRASIHRVDPSTDETANKRPSELKSIERTRLARSSSGSANCHFAVSQAWTLPSLVAVTNRELSGLKATWSIALSCTSGGAAAEPVAKRQHCAIEPGVIVATNDPSGLTANRLIVFGPRMPVTVGSPVSTSHTCIVFRTAVSSRFPSGLKAQQVTGPV
jgi:hypothetical protein